MKRLLGFPMLTLALIVSVPVIAATKTVTLSVPGMNCAESCGWRFRSRAATASTPSAMACGALAIPGARQSCWRAI